MQSAGGSKDKDGRSVAGYVGKCNNDSLVDIVDKNTSFNDRNPFIFFFCKNGDVVTNVLTYLDLEEVLPLFRVLKVEGTAVCVELIHRNIKERFFQAKKEHDEKERREWDEFYEYLNGCDWNGEDPGSAKAYREEIDLQEVYMKEGEDIWNRYAMKFAPFLEIE